MTPNYLWPISCAKMYTDVKPADGYGFPSASVEPNSAIMHEYFSEQTPPTVARPAKQSYNTYYRRNKRIEYTG